MLSELSIVIPTLNEEHYLPKLLTSLSVQNFQGLLQIIVVDGGSTDKTIEKAKEFSKVFEELLILKTHKGIGHQRNRGAEKARYRYFLFIDADIVLSSNVLNTITKTFNPEEHFVASVFLLPGDGDAVDRCIFFLAYLVIAMVSLFKPVTSGGFLLTSKENHKRIAGFREDVFLGEDADYGDRSMQKGARFYFLFPNFVFHSSRRSVKMGKLRMLIGYVRIYWYYLWHGPIVEKVRFQYSFGEYERYY